MTSIYDDTGKMIAVTVIQVEPNVVTQVKTADTDNYEALQLSMGKTKIKMLPNHYKVILKSKY